MSNPMKYIKDLEAVGFQRNQAEAQVQMVLDAIEGDLATKNDIEILRSDLKNDIEILRSDLKNDIEILKRDLKNDFEISKSDLKNEFAVSQERFDRRLIEAEFRLITRLGLLTVSSTSIAVAVLTWLVRI